jgi:NADH-quinone oxidoreductase subunit M
MLSFLSGVITFIQTDIKKIVAYSRVTHITLIIIGFTTNRKMLVIIVLLVSLAHGWVAISLFLTAGITSHSVNSRLRRFLGTEISLHWVIILLSILLIANARVPPLPSFFSELFIVFCALLKGGLITLSFLGLRVVVCYYNAFLFLSLRHMKPISAISRKFILVDGISILILAIIRGVSLVWLTTV